MYVYQLPVYVGYVVVLGLLQPRRLGDPVVSGLQLPRLVVLHGGALEARRGKRLDGVDLLVGDEAVEDDDPGLQVHLLLLHRSYTADG